MPSRCNITQAAQGPVAEHGKYIRWELSTPCARVKENRYFENNFKFATAFNKKLQTNQITIFTLHVRTYI